MKTKTQRAITFLLSTAILMGIVGCNSMQKNKQNQSKPEKVALEQVTPAQPNNRTEQPVKQPNEIQANKPEKIEQFTPDKPLTSAPTHKIRKHIVQKGDTLFKLARYYYGDQKYWKKIWLANKEIIPDPNNIKVGQELIIP